MEETECPSCLNKSADITAKFQAGEPCPHCGLSAQSAKEVIRIRRGYATDALKERLADLIVRVDIAERRLNRLHNFISRAVSEFQQVITYTDNENSPEGGSQ